MNRISTQLKEVLKKLKRNRAFRAALRALQLLTLFLFGICLVSFISAATQIFTIGDGFIEALMRWSLILLLGAIVLLFITILSITAYDYIKLTRQRRKRAEIERP